MPSPNCAAASDERPGPARLAHGNPAISDQAHSLKLEFPRGDVLPLTFQRSTSSMALLRNDATSRGALAMRAAPRQQWKRERPARTEAARKLATAWKKRKAASRTSAPAPTLGPGGRSCRELPTFPPHLGVPTKAVTQLFRTKAQPRGKRRVVLGPVTNRPESGGKRTGFRGREGKTEDERWLSCGRD
jgi:hypothetical protein